MNTSWLCCGFDNIQGLQLTSHVRLCTSSLQAAVEFLVMAQQPQQAFEVAQVHGQMDAYVRFVGAEASSEDLLAAASHYETRGNVETAAQLYAKYGQPDVALRLYMQVLYKPVPYLQYDAKKCTELTEMYLLCHLPWASYVSMECMHGHMCMEHVVLLAIRSV